MLVRVAVGIILREGSVFLAFRNISQHQGGLWEFPGGKCEDLESPEAALVRELKEECGITVISSSYFQSVRHDYGDKQVELCFYKVSDFSGEAMGKEGQETRWVPIVDLPEYDFPEANKIIVSSLLSSPLN